MKHTEQVRTQAAHIENIDPIGRLVRSRFSPLQFAILILLISLSIDLIGGFTFKALWSTNSMGLFQDPTALFVDLVLYPVMCGYYIWSIDAANNIVENLQESKILIDQKYVVEKIGELRVKLGNKILLYVTFILSAIVALLFLGTFLDWYPWGRGVGWLNHSDVLPWLRLPIWFIGSYALCFGILNIAITILMLRGLFRGQSIKLSPWHPDRCGGINVISKYSLNLSYVMAVIGVDLSIAIIQEVTVGISGIYYLGWFGIVLYFFLAPLVFFWPLGTAHSAMREAKNGKLLSLSEEFDKEYKFAMLESNDTNSLEVRIKKIQQIRELYKLTEEFPVWPFDVANVRRFLSVITAPVIPGIVSLGFDLVKKVFIP